MSSIKEVAKQVAENILDPWDDVLPEYLEDAANRIEKALNAERERAAKIAETAFTPAHTYTSENAERYHAFDDGQKHAINKITAAIRKGD